MKLCESPLVWLFAFTGILFTAGGFAQTSSTSKATQAAKTLKATESFLVLTPEQLKQWWTPDKPHSQPPKYPVSALRSQVSGCVAVAFVIHTDGSATPIRLLHTVAPDADRGVRKELESVTIVSLAQSHYLPTLSNHSRSPVLTYEVTTFRIDGSRISDIEWKKECEVPDFVRDMQQAESNPAPKSSS